MLSSFLSWAMVAATPFGSVQDLSVGGGRPGNTVVVGGRTALVLRAERDVTSLRIHVRPNGEAAVRSPWTVRLLPLPRTEEPAAPDVERAKREKAVWQAVVKKGEGEETSVRSFIPRNTFESWLLLLEPPAGVAGKPQSLTVRVEPTVVSFRAREEWLLSVRKSFNPEADRERVRDTVRYLTDAETRRWTGFLTRRVFLRVWRRATLEELRLIYPEEQSIIGTVAHRLPGGLSLVSNSRVGGQQ